MLKKALRYPGATIIVLATLFGAAGALSQNFSLGEGASAGFAVLFFTAVFILLPFWVLAFIVSRIYKRNKVSYDQGRLWFWAIPAALAVVLAIYFGVVGEQSQNTSGGISGVVILFFYIYLSVIGLVVAMISSMVRLWNLKLGQKENKK